MSSFPWLRLYTETLTDKKFKLISAETGLPRPLIMGTWCSLLMLAGESPERGKLVYSRGKPIRFSFICDEIGVDEATGQAILDQFIELDMLYIDDGGVYTITKWDERQFRSDDAYARVKKFRDKKKVNPSPETPPETVDDNASGNVSETFQETPQSQSQSQSQSLTSSSSSKPPTKKETLNQIGDLCREHFSDPTQDPFRADLLQAIKAYSPVKVLWAIQTALSPKRQNGRSKSWGYVMGILEKDVLEGKNRAVLVSGPSPPQPSGRAESPPIDQDLLERLQAGKE